jgi:hypothetical protein
MAAVPHKYLARKPGSVNRQLYVRDRWVAARTLYGALFGDEARIPEEIAVDYDLPLEAVQEAIAWCETDPQELHDDFEAEEALDRAMSASADAQTSAGDLSRQCRP